MERPKWLHRENAKYLIPNAMTASRPIIGGIGIYKLSHGETLEGVVYIGAAGLTDADGTVARALKATSEFGAKFDPVMDTIYRAELIFGLGIEPTARVVTIAAEAVVLAVNLIHLKVAETKEDEPKARFIGKVRIPIYMLTGAMLAFHPGNELSSRTMAGAAVAASVDYSWNNVKKIREIRKRKREQ